MVDEAGTRIIKTTIGWVAAWKSIHAFIVLGV